MTESYDIAIVGAGIVGLATTLALTSQVRGLRIVVLEKESAIASHQTGHNSGVIHSGIYYKPRSLKAILCVSGARQLIAFCDRHGIAYQHVGKVIVATVREELPLLQNLYERALANGIEGIKQIDPARLREIEPHAAGLGALYSANTAIVDYRLVSAKIREELESNAVAIKTSTRVIAISGDKDGLVIETTQGDFHCKHLINCAGLYSDVIARLAGVQPQLQIIPFRGEYYFLKPVPQNLVSGLIYPVADPRFPFLGVHFTRTLDGHVEAGPNAVLGFAREGYGWTRVNLRELGGTLLYAGFWKMARRWWRKGAYEFYRSLSKPEFVHSLQKLVPEIRTRDLERGGTGVRAQAVNDAGELVDDFCIVETPRSVHVLNAPSPAATASLAVGDYIAARSRRVFGW